MITMAFLAMWLNTPVWTKEGPCWAQCMRDRAQPSILHCNASCTTFKEAE